MPSDNTEDNTDTPTPIVRNLKSGLGTTDPERYNHLPYPPNWGYLQSSE